MTDGAVRVWLVDREFTDKGLVTLVYATSDGDLKLVEQRAANQLEDVTAARDVDSDRLVSTQDATEQERYASEADRMADRHDPDERV
jgi:conjugal transfer/entry exclusion protein